MTRNRTMTRDDLEVVLGWAANEGWNPGLDDAEAFFAADPEGFFVAEADGRPVAAISVVNHSDRFAFLGLYLCLPSFRGLGIGYALWQHALDHAGDRIVGLDGVPAQQDNYRKSGFVLTDRTRRYVGRFDAATHPAVRRFHTGDLPRLIDIDARANGYGRARFLRPWLTGTSTRRTLVFDPGTGPAGSVTLRTCREGTKIGPLTAPDMETAAILLAAAAADAPHGPLVIDVPDNQGALAAWCRGNGMTVPFETARMYRGPAPQGEPMIASAATLELG